MTYNNSLGRQQKVIVSLGAAIGSFVIGAMLPLYSTLLEDVALPDLPLNEVESKVFEDSPSVQVAVRQQVDGFKNTLVQFQKEKEKRLTFSAPARFAGKTISDVQLTGKQKFIALTFDDGPWPDTPAILEVLKKNKVKATFFVIGRHLQLYPDMARRVVAEGHAVGNHTWNHHYHRVDRATAIKEIEDTSALIYKITGAKTTLFRPPGGVLTNGLADYAMSQKMTVAMWSSDSQESSQPSQGQLIKNVMGSVKSGGIVLMHDGGGERSVTLKSLPVIIAELKKQGYTFVTVPELLALKDRQLKAAAAAKAKFTKPASVKVKSVPPAESLKSLPKSLRR